MSSYRHMQHQGHAVFPTSPLPGREGEGRGRAERIRVRRAAVAHRSGRPLAATARLVRALRPCAVSPCLQAPQPTPHRLVPLLAPGCSHPRRARLDKAGRPLQNLALGSNEDRPSPAAATDIEHGTTHPFSL